MKLIQKARREWFGGVIFSETQGVLALFDNQYADRIGLLRIENLPEGIFSAPVDVELFLTTRCNRTCQGCHIHQPGQPDRDLPYERALRIVDNLGRLNIFRLILTGGEPLLYPQLFDLAALIRKCNIAPVLMTNGLTIDAATAARCTVFASVYLGCGSPRELEDLQGVIALLIREGVRPALNLHVNRDNLQALPAIFSLAARRGIEKIKVGIYKSAAASTQAAILRLSSDQQRDLYQLLVSLARRFKITPQFDCALYPAIAFQKPGERELRNYNIGGCQGGNMTLAIDTEGNLRPCPFWPEHCGPAESMTASQWLASPILQRFRQGPPAEPCAQCAYLEACNRGCRLTERQACGTQARSLLKQGSL